MKTRKLKPGESVTVSSGNPFLGIKDAHKQGVRIENNGDGVIFVARQEENVTP